ncbi:hypothetical protein J437_LFUL005016, partial [Ladona fulva]
MTPTDDLEQFGDSWNLGASMTWLPPETPAKPKPEKIEFCQALRQIWATLAVHCMVILVGMTLGFSAILIPQLEESDSDIVINKVDASWLASIISIVAPIGSLSSGPVVQWLGSKQTIRLSLIPYALGWLLISFANGLPMLLAGWLITGLVKIDMSSVPEKAKELMRGLDVSKISEVSDHEFDNEDDVTVRRRKKAEQTYTFLMDEHQRNLKKQMQDNFGKEKGYEGNLLGIIPNSTSPSGKSKKRSGILRRLEILFTHSTGWKPLLMLTIMFVFQQFAGVYITLFYAVNVFKEMGGGALDEYIASILVGVVRFFMSLVNIWLFRKYGRRPLITISAAAFGNTPCIVYITEVSSPHLRSMLTATGPTLGSLGILMAYVLGWLFSWRTVALVPAAWNLVCLAVLATIPESPIWLISHEKFEEARKAVYWFHDVKMAG